MSVSGSPVARRAHAVAWHLREDYRLHRRQAEWLCFRMLGMLENGLHRYSAKDQALTLYTEWVKRLEREYDTL